ncbi:MAG TPA: hypothetical protein DF409_12405 [Bacteroidales bacterium]|jgi:hypothetical protein|nr:hypothetical protein [Bacteroidales bacterium]
MVIWLVVSRSIYRFCYINLFRTRPAPQVGRQIYITSTSKNRTGRKTEAAQTNTLCNTNNYVNYFYTSKFNTIFYLSVF